MSVSATVLVLMVCVVEGIYIPFSKRYINVANDNRTKQSILGPKLHTVCRSILQTEGLDCYQCKLPTTEVYGRAHRPYNHTP